MKLGILLCDQVSPALAVKYGQYPEMFMNLLKRADSTLESKVFNVENGEFPKSIHEVDAYLISGSRHGVYDDYPWIKQLEQFVRLLHLEQKKLVGICFGHQLVAQALGGTVVKSPKGWGVGMSQNQVYHQKEWMVPKVEQFNILVSHQDQVIELPPGAELLAGSDFCPNYMLQVGSTVLTIQGHPEFTKDYSRDLMVSKEDKVSESEFSRAIQSLALEENDGLIAEWIVRFISN
ncbi:glutamine amidotransferase-related protein [Legionella waltersii]|uniref:Glutamine amidotransferase, class I n=1 Tax=Legionella waltersii TaxID=66969 RepID=A0A0W0ZZY0_9GAMM|nr:glutamine amidotransferase [Legionella waltersii]KTD74679.1 glutamine amidotransferase, class I [Legionella waltersii]SNV09184.1 GMP synthase [Legionella waltersii]